MQFVVSNTLGFTGFRASATALSLACPHFPFLARTVRSSVYVLSCIVSMPLSPSPSSLVSLPPSPRCNHGRSSVTLMNISTQNIIASIPPDSAKIPLYFRITSLVARAHSDVQTCLFL